MKETNIVQRIAENHVQSASQVVTYIVAIACRSISYIIMKSLPGLCVNACIYMHNHDIEVFITVYLT